MSKNSIVRKPFSNLYTSNFCPLFAWESNHTKLLLSSKEGRNPKQSNLVMSRLREFTMLDEH